MDKIEMTLEQLRELNVVHRFVKAHGGELPPTKVVGFC